jgi:hypothetical protein
MAQEQEQKNILAGNTFKREQFPTDEYISACCIGFFFAGLKPNQKYSKSKDPVPSVKFLMAGYLRNPDGTIKVDEDGEKVVVRKWTNWKSLSYGEKAGLVQLFKGVPNLQGLLTSNAPDGELWKTPFKILVEAAAKDGYSNITRIKLGGTDDVLDITYNKDFVPYKVVKAYGEDVTLEQAYLKTDEGVKIYTNEQMVEPPVESDN